jgi:hypothetical protein
LNFTLFNGSFNTLKIILNLMNSIGNLINTIFKNH